MPIKKFPDNLDATPEPSWPGWDHEHSRLETLIDMYHRSSERYEVMVTVNRTVETEASYSPIPIPAGPAAKIEFLVLDFKTEKTYHGETVVADAKKLPDAINDVRGRLESDSALEAYIAQLEAAAAKAKQAKPKRKK